MVSTSYFHQFLCVMSLYYTALNSKCQIKTGSFPTSGAKVLNTTYTSGDMLLYYKMWIPQHIDITAKDFNDTAKIPMLVLVHGYGPLNHDLEINWTLPSSSHPIYTFRDIAYGLCTFYNIIVFTYDKRSCSLYSSIPCLQNQPPLCDINNTADDWCFNISNVTYLDLVGDAINAVKYIQVTYPFINPSNIVPTGHSQGASFVPWVANYMNLSTSIALMGTGVTPDLEWLYALQEMGENQSVIDEYTLTFEMIKNGSLKGWTPIDLLGGPAIFWKQWIDAETNQTRLIHLRKLKNILTINSDTDGNVPPVMYQPLYSLINIVSGNVSYNLHASMNVVPNLIHLMVSNDDMHEARYNVSDDVIYLIGSWINRIFRNTESPTNESDDEGMLTLNEEEVIIFAAIAGIFVLLLITCMTLVLKQRNKINQMKMNRNDETSKLLNNNSVETTIMKQ